MPIVDISGLSKEEEQQKKKIRQRIKHLYRERLGIPPSATTVTFITDETAGTDVSVHVMARLYSKMFMGMPQTQLDSICDDVVFILEELARHDFHEAFPIPVMAMRGGSRPYRPGT